MTVRAAAAAPRIRRGDVRLLVSGAIILAIAMGVGRFAYTPLIPVMESDAGLTVASAGSLAFANLLGYLAGAALAMHPLAHRNRLALIRAAVVTVVAATALMAAPFAAVWPLLRFFTGVASGLALVFASSIVLERAAKAGRPAWPPLFFMGVGSGIAFSGIAVPAFAALGGSKGAWLGVAACSALAFAATASWFRDDAPPGDRATGGTDAPLPHDKNTFGWLLTVYTVEAFAYIIPATFLIAIIKRVPQIAPYAASAWVLVGVASALATFPWIVAARKLGKARTLGLALVVQAVGIAAPVALANALGAGIAAFTLGATFITITLLSAGLGRDMFPHRTSAAVSRLTVLYSVGQMIGPLAATQIALRFGSYDVALEAAAVAAAVAAVLMFAAVRDPVRI